MATLPADVVSPELVLIDSELAERARQALTEPRDTFAALLDRPTASRATGVRRTPYPPIHAPADSAAALRRLSETQLEWEEFRPRRRRILAALAFVAATAVAGVLVLASVPGRHPAAPRNASTLTADDTSSPVREPERNARTAKPKPARKETTAATSFAREGGGVRVLPKPPRPSASGKRASSSSASTPSVVLWPAKEGATRYHVEVFRRGSRVFVTDSDRARVTIPATWDLGGVTQHLEPGDELYVWPVIDGKLSSSAIVHGPHQVDPQ